MQVYFDANNLVFGSYPNIEVAKVSYIYEELTALKLNVVKARSINMSVGAIFNNELTRFAAQEEILLGGGDMINLKNCIVEAPIIKFYSPRIELQSLFIKGADYLQFENADEKSLVRAIRFTFDNKSNFPCFVDGDIDLSTGHSQKSIVAFGVIKIEILFGDTAFNS